MEVTGFALWLNTFFAGFDKFFLTIQHFFGEHMGGLLTPVMKLVTVLGEKGILFLLISVGLMCFAKTRRLGVCMFGAVCCGALVTNIILKDAVARPRPFEGSELYRQWWETIGSPVEDGYSFPSGHVTAAAAGMAAVCLMEGKRWIAPSAAIVVIMAISRNYLMAHYPSDVFFAMLIGAGSACIAKIITKLIFDFAYDMRDNKICSLILDWDLPVKLPRIGYKGKHEL